MRRLLVPLLIAAAAMTAPAGAHAATVTFGSQCGHPLCLSGVDVRAEPGERNDMVVRVDAAGEVVVTERAASLRTSSYGCRTTAPGEIRCPRSSFLTVELGDGDDRAELESEPGGGPLSVRTVSGGAGDDVLLGGPTGEELTGGSGTDRILAGAGDDLLADGDAATTEDVYDGGPGADTARYGGRTAPVTLSLTDLDGNEDRLAGIESLGGGGGDDVLVGDGGPNTLEGGRGDDLVVGGSGDDRVAGDAGRDVVRGGAGRDVLSPIVFSGNQTDYDERDPDDVDCGDGFDLVDRTRAQDVIDDSCERVRPGFPEQLAPSGTLVRLRDPVVRLRGTFCPYEQCHDVVTVRVAAIGRPRRRARPGTLLGRRVIRLGRNEHGAVAAVRLSRAGRRALRDHRRLPVVVTHDSETFPPESFAVVLRYRGS